MKVFINFVKKSLIKRKIRGEIKALKRVSILKVVEASYNAINIEFFYWILIAVKFILFIL